MCSICVVLLMSTAPYSYVRYHFFNMGVNSYLLFSPCWFVSVITSINRKKKSFALSLNAGIHLIGKHHMGIWWHGYFNVWGVQLTAWSTSISYTWFSDRVGFLSSLPMTLHRIWLHLTSTLRQKHPMKIMQNWRNALVTSCRFIWMQNSKNSNFLCWEEYVTEWCGTISVCSRCVMKFNQIVKYSLFSFFSWNMLGVASMLVSIQFILVEWIVSKLIQKKNKY